MFAWGEKKKEKSYQRGWLKGKERGLEKRGSKILREKKKREHFGKRGRLKKEKLKKRKKKKRKERENQT